MDRLRFTQHISRQFNTELEHVRSDVLRMGGLVEEQLGIALAGLRDRQLLGLERVREAEREINRLELSIDEACLRIMVRRQPAASDLRLLLSAGRIVADLERMGDEASRLARLTGRQQRPSAQIDGMRLEIREAAMFEGAFVGCHEHDPRRLARLERLLPARRAETPAITGAKSGKAEGRQWRRQVIAGGSAEFEEFVRHHRAHGMRARILGSGVAATVTEKTRKRLIGTGRKRFAEHVSAFDHHFPLLTSRLPKLSLSKRPINASGSRPKPSTMS